MKLLQSSLRYARDPRIFGSALALVVAGIIAWCIAPGDERLFNFLLLFSTLGALSVTTLNIWISRWESLRKPVILIGIGDPGNLSYQVKPKWGSERELSEPLSLRVAMRNAGTKTARQVLYNVVLPKDIKNRMASFHIGGISLSKLDEPDVLRYVYSTRDLLPGPVNTQQIEVAFPRGSRDYHGHLIVYVDEDPPYQQNFVIEVREEQSNPQEGGVDETRLVENE
jgi:hypothetical protein